MSGATSAKSNVTNKYKVVSQYSEKAKAPSFLPIPEELESKLLAYLVFNYKKNGLYKHQALAIEKILQGENVVLSTPTASGKSLVFCVPVIQSLLEDPDATSIFLFPQKALSADQEKKLNQLIDPFNFPQNCIGRFDGTVKGAGLRKQIIRDSRILLATPDVLHATILRSSGDRMYRSFFRRLRYVILDECHLYDGVFGTNMAMLLRRLRQVANWEGVNPQFIAASATIEDPAAHLENLTGLSFINIGSKEDGSGSGGRDYRLLRPEEGASMFEVVFECVQEALAQDEKILIFLDSRQGVESLSNYLREQLGDSRDLCAPYRAGYTPAERDKIEAGLDSGQVRCVVSTSAMELGIDVSGLSRCILCGVAQDRTSFFQRIGRLGRGLDGGRGKVDIIFGKTSVDEYYFRYPELLWEGRFNPCHLNLNNERLVADHAACVTFEAQLVKGRKPKKSILGPELFSRIMQNPQSKSYAYSHSSIQNENPHLELNLRMINDPSYKLFVGKNKVLGELTWSQVLREAYEGAIYRRLGKCYRVERITRGRVQVKPISGKNLKVKPIAKTVTKRRFYVPDTQITAKASNAKLTVRSAWFNVMHFVLGYNETKEDKTTQHLYGEQMLSDFMATQGLDFVLQRPDGFYPPAARALANAIFKAAPLVANINMKDLTCDLSCREGECHIRILDNAEGGLGLSWKLALHLPEIVSEAERMLKLCSNCSQNEEQDGCILCCRMATDSATDLIDRKGGIELAGWLKTLLQKGEVETKSQDTKQQKQTAARENTGFVLSPNSIVFITGIYKIGKVISSEAYHDQDRLYKLQVGKDERQFMGSTLELVKGQMQLWCLGCNTENIPLGTEVCPSCGLPLAYNHQHVPEK